MCVHVCMFTYMCVCIGICVCNVCLYAHNVCFACTLTYVSVLFICLGVCELVRLHMWASMRECMCACVSVHVRDIPIYTYYTLYV